MSVEYGPPRPHDIEEGPYTDLRTPRYLRGHANKILYDLKKVFRMYNARLIRIYDNGTGDRCTTCTDSLTGAKVLKDCPDCQGTGRSKRALVGEFWSLIDFGPKNSIASGSGNMESIPGSRDVFTVIDAPLLMDQWIIVVKDMREVFKIIDVEPQIVAMQGIVITQLASCGKLPAGDVEYKVIDW